MFEDFVFILQSPLNKKEIVQIPPARMYKSRFRGNVNSFIFWGCIGYKLGRLWF